VVNKKVTKHVKENGKLIRDLDREEPHNERGHEVSHQNERRRTGTAGPFPSNFVVLTAERDHDPGASTPDSPASRSRSLRPASWQKHLQFPLLVIFSTTNTPTNPTIHQCASISTAAEERGVSACLCHRRGAKEQWRRPSTGSGSCCGTWTRRRAQPRPSYP
jgi:hypothetical protein